MKILNKDIEVNQGNPNSLKSDRRLQHRAVIFGRRATDQQGKSETELRKLEMLAISMGEIIHQLMIDPTIIEIMLNPDGKLWAESITTGHYFTGFLIDPITALSVIQLVASDKATVCDEQHPRLSAELPGAGSRFQAQLPPIVSRPAFSIRKPALLVFTLSDYVAQGVLSARQKSLICDAVLARKNILIAGGTGSGKTTLANAVLAEVAATNDRVITLEDTLELQCTAADCYSMRTVENVVTLRDLVKDCLRLRPDRIVVGEVRDGVALDLLKAWSTGHPGGIATVHANGAEAALQRLKALMSEVVSTPDLSLIGSAVDLVIYIEKNSTHARRMIREIRAVDRYNTRDSCFITSSII